MEIFEQSLKFALVFVVCVVFVSCTKRLSSSPQNASGLNDQLSVSVYPHSATFRVTSEHGNFFRQNQNTCKTCHGEDLRGGNAKVSCNQCHSAYPHSTSFKTSVEHGEVYFKDRQQCVSCHHDTKPNAQGVTKSNSPAFCLNCHNYPHESLWHLPANHGKAFLNQAAGNQPVGQLVNCGQCHAVDSHIAKQHKEIAVACNTCHSDMPHSKEFMEDHSTLAKESAVNCTVCHRDYKALMPNYQDSGGCFTCHAEGSKLNLKWFTPEAANSNLKMKSR